MLAQQTDHTNLARHAGNTTATRTLELMLAQPAGSTTEPLDGGDR